MHYEFGAIGKSTCNR